MIKLLYGFHKIETVQLELIESARFKIRTKLLLLKYISNFALFRKSSVSRELRAQLASSHWLEVRALPVRMTLV